MSVLHPARDRPAALLEAVTTLARITIDNKPEQTLDLLETARNLEPLNEAIYRDIIRIQQRLGRPDAAAATFQLLPAQLADIDATPSPATVRPRAQNRGTRLHRIDNPRTPGLPCHHVLAATRGLAATNEFLGGRRKRRSDGPDRHASLARRRPPATAPAPDRPSNVVISRARRSTITVVGRPHGSSMSGLVEGSAATGTR